MAKIIVHYSNKRNVRNTQHRKQFFNDLTALLTLIMVTVVGFASAQNIYAAENPEEGDIRDLKVGIDVSELPPTGYVRLRCVGPMHEASDDASSDDASSDDASSDDASIELTGWDDSQRCKKDKEGLRHVGFDYDDSTQQWAPVNDKWEGTKLAGHPVLLSLVINDSGRVVALHARTDPEARAYMRKKAYLLSLRVKSRYGRDGWTCTKHRPSENHTPIGGVFLHEHCEKALNKRSIVLETRLYRSKNQDSSESTNSTEFSITSDES